MLIEKFSKDILNKEIPLNILKICMYLLTNNKDSIDIDETCKQMYITKRKLMGEIDKTQPLEGFFRSDKEADGTLVFFILDRKYYLTSQKKKKATENTAKNEKDEIILRIFDFWRVTMGKSTRTKLDRERRKNINTALSLDYSEKDCCKAILGCSKNPWNMGHNPRQKEYNSLELIFRNAEYIEGFMKEAEGLDLEEKIKLENSNGKKHIEERLSNNDWLEDRMKMFEGSQNATQKNQTLLVDKSFIYDVEGLAKESAKFFEIEETNIDNIEDAVFEEIMEEDIPLYLKIAKGQKD